MPSPDPIIESLLVKVRFSNVEQLGHIKTDDAVVTVWLKGGDLNHTLFIFLLVNAQSPWKMLLVNWVYMLMENQLLVQHFMIENKCA